MNELWWLLIVMGFIGFLALAGFIGAFIELMEESNG